jgi:hypothetical protein
MYREVGAISGSPLARPDECPDDDEGDDCPADEDESGTKNRFAGVPIGPFCAF